MKINSFVSSIVKKSAIQLSLSLALFLPLALSCETTVIDIRRGKGMALPAKAMNGPGEGMGEAPPDAQKRDRSLLFGIKEIGTPVEIPCEDTPERIVIRKDGYDSILHFFLGIAYTSRSVSVYCAPGQKP